jgi:hypothetical protein
MMILASEAAFAFLHIIFRNPLAPALTFAGGVLFAAAMLPLARSLRPASNMLCTGAGFLPPD